MLENIGIGKDYTEIADCNNSVEVIQFKDFELENDLYVSKIQTVIYVDSDGSIQSMQIDTFASKFC